MKILEQAEQRMKILEQAEHFLSTRGPKPLRSTIGIVGASFIHSLKLNTESYLEIRRTLKLNTESYLEIRRT